MLGAGCLLWRSAPEDERNHRVTNRQRGGGGGGGTVGNLEQNRERKRAVAEIWSRHLDSATPVINAAVFQEARTETTIVDLDQLLKKLKASVVVSLLLEFPKSRPRRVSAGLTLAFPSKENFGVWLLPYLAFAMANAS